MILLDTYFNGQTKQIMNARHIVMARLGRHILVSDTTQVDDQAKWANVNGYIRYLFH